MLIYKQWLMILANFQQIYTLIFPHQKMKKRNFRIYISIIPFCVRKCNYCDFFSASGTEEEQAAYVSGCDSGDSELSGIIWRV